MNQRIGRWGVGVALVGAMLGAAGCAPAEYRKEADQAAYNILEQKQQQAVGRDEPFTIETPADTLRRRLVGEQNLPVSGRASLGSDELRQPAHWPEPDYPARSTEGGDAIIPPSPADQPVQLTLIEALQVGARNSREYQTQKENVFRAALALDLELDAFRNTYSGILSALLLTDQGSGDSVTGVVESADLAVTRRFRNGVTLGGRIAFDLVQLLSDPGEASSGILADLTVSIPLLRGAGEHIVTEPLKQAEREVIYAFWAFETFRRGFVVQVASSYLNVLQQLDQVDNAAENYRNLVSATRRAQRLADAGRLPPIQADQALQDELRARDRWIRARDGYSAALDRFKITLGLPTDARIVLDPDELTRLAEAASARLEAALAAERRVDGTPDAGQEIVLVEPSREYAGPYEQDPERAIRLALEARLDLREANGRVYDAQRFVVVAADALEAGATLTGGGTFGASRGLGGAVLDDVELRPERGVYSLGLDVDLPLERTAERNAYRNAYISLERSVRDVQSLEDSIKLDIRDGLRTLAQARESFVIQYESVALAERRVESTNAFLQAGRAEVRDVLEAQESLVAAQDALTAALVDYRVAELEIQRDMGLLQIDDKGLWREHEPDQRN